MDENEPKISQVETFMVLAPLAVLDLVDVALLFAGLDDFFIIDAAAFPLTQFYFRMKGIRANYMLTSNLLELVPYMGKLPMRTIGAAITIRAANKPEGIVAEAVNIGSAVVRKKLQTAKAASEGMTKEGEEARQKLEDFEIIRRKAAVERGDNDADATPYANSSLVKEVPDPRYAEGFGEARGRRISTKEKINPSPQAVPSLYERENLEKREAA